MTERPKVLPEVKRSSQQQAQDIAEKMHRPDYFARNQNGYGARPQVPSHLGLIHPTKGIKSKRKKAQLQQMLRKQDENK
jgi:hypothetical protein